MSNFLEFINKDIENKKTILSAMPTKTKTNIKKYNETIEEYAKRYAEYKDSLKKYLEVKSKSFSIKEKSPRREELKKEINDLQKAKFILRSNNTYYEKMGFDDLMYELSNSYMFNFESLNDVINELLDKFELIDIRLTNEEFNYTCYVNEYMTSFLEVRYNKKDTYKKVSEIFEKIYWVNPELINHIELNFRRLIRKYEKKFENYISKLQKEIMTRYNFKTYKDCLEKIEQTYAALTEENRENITDIIKLSLEGAFDINQYLENNKVRTNAFDSLAAIDLKDNDKNSKLLNTLEDLKNNIKEYSSYLEFKPLFETFKSEYEPLLKASKDEKGLKNINSKIASKEKELDKINKKLLNSSGSVTDLNVDNKTKLLRVESVEKAKELYALYDEYDNEYFKNRVLNVLNESITVSDVLNLYSGYSYFKKRDLQKAFNLTENNQIVEYNDLFEEYALDASNVISAGIPIFEDKNVEEIIANKYRLNNLKITEIDLQEQNLKPLLNKINLIIRVITVENSETSIEKIWFMTKVDKLKD